MSRAFPSRMLLIFSLTLMNPRECKIKKMFVMFIAELGNSTQILRKHFLNFWLLNNVKFMAITSSSQVKVLVEKDWSFSKKREFCQQTEFNTQPQTLLQSLPYQPTLQIMDLPVCTSRWASFLKLISLMNLTYMCIHIHVYTYICTHTHTHPIAFLSLENSDTATDARVCKKAMFLEEKLCPI